MSPDENDHHSSDDGEETKYDRQFSNVENADLSVFREIANEEKNHNYSDSEEDLPSHS